LAEHLKIFHLADRTYATSLRLSVVVCTECTAAKTVRPGAEVTIDSL